jgi:hypothetical protein
MEVQELLVLKVTLDHQDSLDQREYRDNQGCQEHLARPAQMVKRETQVHRDHPVSRDFLGRLARRGNREHQDQQEIPDLRATRAMLDPPVQPDQREIQVHKDRRALMVNRDNRVQLVNQDQQD